MAVEIENLEEEIDRLNSWNEENRFQEVLADADILIKQDPVEAPLYVLKGNALYGLGRFTEALDAYAMAIEIDTFDVQARCNYGSTLYTLGRYVDALNACDAAILVDNQFAPAYINSAHCLVALKHEDEAVYALRQAYSLITDDFELGRSVAEMATDLENYDVAFDTYLDMASQENAPDECQQAMYGFLKKCRENNMDRLKLTQKIDQWRNKFPTNPLVIRLSSDLLRG